MRICPTCNTQWTQGEAFCPHDGTRLRDADTLPAPPPDPWLGKLVDGRYKLVQLLGSGGMGFVYRARHEKLGNEVAIKILRDSEAANEEVVERFRREAESATRIGHPGIVRVTDFGVTGAGSHFMVMELLEGEDISKRLAAEGAFAPDRAVHLLLEACEALEAAHRAGIVHRDLKPENLFLARLSDGRERLKVVDFGLAKMNDLALKGPRGAKLTKTGTVFGTPKYMAPEQGLGNGADARSDVYSLGCIAYEMFTGVAPFDGENYLGIVNQHLFDPPPPFASVNPNVHVPPALELVVHRALAKKPDERLSSMEEFGLALSRASGIELPPPAVSNATPRPYVLGGAPRSVPPPGRAMPSTRPLRIDEPDLVGRSIPPLPTRGGGLLPLAVGALVVAAGLAAVYLLR